METFKAKVLVHNISYVFNLDGSITPILNIKPSVVLNDGRIVSKLPVGLMDPESDAELAPDDVIELYFTEESVTVKVVECSDQPRVSLVTDTCPICHEPIFPSKKGIGRCINRGCSAQISQTILLFASALGLVFQHPVKKILEYLLARGALITPTSLFTLEMHDLCFPNISILEAQMFQKYIHSVRGSVTIEQLLRGLRVPFWGEKEIQYMHDLFEKNGWTLLELPQFFQGKIIAKYKGIDWGPWLEFTSLESNRKIITELCNILYV